MKSKILNKKRSFFYHFRNFRPKSGHRLFFISCSYPNYKTHSTYYYENERLSFLAIWHNRNRFQNRHKCHNCYNSWQIQFDGHIRRVCILCEYKINVDLHNCTMFLNHTFYQMFNHIILGCIPSNFKTSIFKPKLPFLRGNRKTDNQGEFPYYDEFSLYMIFATFLGHSDYGYFVWKILKIIWGDFVKIQEFTLSFLWFSPKNHHSGLKMNILKFLGI